MPAFSAIVGAAKRPAVRVVALPPDGYAGTWEGDRPQTVQAVGLRTLSEGDLETARAEAARIAWEAHPDRQAGADAAALRVAAYEDAEVRLVVARAACKPDDQSAPFHDLPDDWARLALTPAAVRLLWDELERLTVATSPTVPEATAEECAELAALVVDAGAWQRLDETDAGRVRRLLAACLTALRGEG